MGNFSNGISSNLRAVRASYNSAIKKDQFYPQKNPFHHFEIPISRGTKKKAISKMDFIKIRAVHYKEGSPVWQAKNYALVMFNCKGMNFIDLVKLRVMDMANDRIFYGGARQETNFPFALQMSSKKYWLFMPRANRPMTIYFPPTMMEAPRVI